MKEEHKEIIRRLFKVAAHKYDSYNLAEKVEVVRDLFQEYRNLAQEGLERIVIEVTNLQ